MAENKKRICPKCSGDTATDVLHTSKGARTFTKCLRCSWREIKGG